VLYSLHPWTSLGYNHHLFHLLPNTNQTHYHSTSISIISSSLALFFSNKSPRKNPFTPHTSNYFLPHMDPPFFFKTPYLHFFSTYTSTPNVVFAHHLSPSRITHTLHPLLVLLIGPLKPHIAKLICLVKIPVTISHLTDTGHYNNLPLDRHYN